MKKNDRLPYEGLSQDYIYARMCNRLKLPETSDDSVCTNAGPSIQLRIYTSEDARSAVEQAGAVKGQAFVHRPQVHCPQHAQVGGHGVPLGAACKQIVLKGGQPGGRDVPEAQVAFRSRKIFHTPQHAAVDVGCTLAACGNEAVNQPLGVRLESRFFFHITLQLTIDN